MNVHGDKARHYCLHHEPENPEKEQVICKHVDIYVPEWSDIHGCVLQKQDVVDVLNLLLTDKQHCHEYLCTQLTNNRF
jgi:ATP adenylyltransferase/5',5'''-P-1,P-4-tetraphosphate phosphorylase II